MAPQASQYNRAYHQWDFWCTFLSYEHEARRVSLEVRRFHLGEDYNVLAVATDDDDEALAAEEVVK
jgi:hypothetical protein